jgi:AcrR family transcriptional regulator
MPDTTRKSTRERLIAAAEELFYRDGFHLVGLDQIIDTVGVTKTTFYNHFESKDDLVLAVIRDHDQRFQREFRTALQQIGGDSPRRQLEAAFDVVDRIVNLENFVGCVFVNVAVEFPQPHHPAHKAAAESKQAVEAIIRDLALQARADDPIWFARQLTLLMEGAYVTAAVTHSPYAVESGRRMARMLIEKHLPQVEQVV